MITDAKSYHFGTNTQQCNDLNHLGGWRDGSTVKIAYCSRKV